MTFSASSNLKVFEDPIFGAVLNRLAKRAKLNGSMLAIQKGARRRSQEKQPDMWKPVDAATREHRKRLGIAAS